MKHIFSCMLLALAALAGGTPRALAITDPIVVGNTRFTFITPNLVRMEYADGAQFLNDSTLFAVDRTPREVDVKIERDGRKYIFTTDAMRLEYDADGFPFGQNNVRALWTQNGAQKKWYITQEQKGNLQGPVVTLDGVGTPIPRLEGLLSRDGWYVINDTGKDIYRNGRLERRDGSHRQDIYLFVYGNDYRSALKSLAAVSGPTPMTRKYVHGAWYCRWWPYTADDYREIVAGYEEHDFPMDVLVFDMDWHRRKDATVGLGHAGTRGWTGYSWNRDLIPDPAGLLKEFSDKNIYVTLNDHPHDGIRPHEDVYKEFVEALGVDTTKTGVPVFNAADPKYMQAFFEYAHRPHENMGVAFWWLDWQQDYAYPLVAGTTTKHLPWLNELYYKDSQQGNKRGAGFSRWGGWGDHRHPIQFSGDVVGSWPMLEYEIDMTTTSGNAGCFFWAHDIGGFYAGLDPELYTRWTQYGMLNSSLRIHSVVGEKMDRRPWLWGERQEKAMREAYHTRARLMPYIYSSVRQCHTDMLPLMRGLYIDRPTDSLSYERPGQYMFGDLLLAAPVCRPGEGPDFVVNQEVYFPQGADWFGLFNGKRYAGGTIDTVPTPLEESPVFVKGGWPLPMQPYTQRMASTPLETLIVRCYPGPDGASNTYTLYEDDGLTTDYAQGSFATTPLTYTNANGAIRVDIAAADGTYEGQPQRRAYKVELPGIAKTAKVKVNGKKARATFDDALGGIVVAIPASDIRRAHTIEVVP